MTTAIAVPQGSGSLNNEFGSTTPRQYGLEEWNEADFGNIIVTGSKKSECQDRVVLCQNLLDKSIQTREKLKQVLGAVPARLSIFAVFDGHGGSECSDFLGKNLIRYYWKCCSEALDSVKDKTLSNFLTVVMTNLCSSLEAAFAEQWKRVGRRDGSCGNIVLIWDSTIVCANVGDSRAMIKNGEEILELSQDHKPDRPDEQKRIESAGAKVVIDRKSLDARLSDGMIAISRAFGNLPIKNTSRALIATPDVVVTQLTPSMQFLLMASDGIWCRLSNAEAVQLVNNELKKSENCHEAARQLAIAAKAKLTNDDCTVIVVSLN
eukprot:c8253_g1_i2.p1 GENE.c8253_g1_i2~~c8253_g1_i2.p1  ORF type:complete len:332 (+),score=164.17 c8253_g1_i2:35-997(+)